MILRLAALIAALALTPAFAADDPLLARLAGDWVGNGTVRTSVTAEPERVFCRITSRLVDDGTALQQTGRCGLATSTGSVDGKITARGGGRYDGTLQSLASQGPTTLSGRARGSSLVLRSEFTDARTGESAVAITTLAPTSDGGYRLTSRRETGGGEGYGETDILFRSR